MWATAKARWFDVGNPYGYTIAAALPMSIPSPKERPFFKKYLFLESASILSGLGGFIDLLLTKFKSGGLPFAGFLFVIYILSNLLKLSNASEKDKEEGGAKIPKEFEAMLTVLHSSVIQDDNFNSADNDIRITIWRVVPPKKINGKAKGKPEEPTDLEQATEYVGGDGGPAGRRHSVHSGLIGKAYRERAVLFATRSTASDADFKQELISVYAYTKSQASEQRMDRWSWMAVPLNPDGTSKNTVGVVFLDAAKPNSFDDPSFQKRIIDGCNGIASFVKNNYSK
jgi:hypothetical protein